jgi:hypothetical protein
MGKMHQAHGFRGSGFPLHSHGNGKGKVQGWNIADHEIRGFRLKDAAVLGTVGLQIPATEIHRGSAVPQPLLARPPMDPKRGGPRLGFGRVDHLEPMMGEPIHHLDGRCIGHEDDLDLCVLKPGKNLFGARRKVVGNLGPKADSRAVVAVVEKFPNRRMFIQDRRPVDIGLGMGVTFQELT